jgi:hypothetical protein
LCVIFVALGVAAGDTTGTPANKSLVHSVDNPFKRLDVRDELGDGRLKLFKKNLSRASYSFIVLKLQSPKQFAAK